MENEKLIRILVGSIVAVVLVAFILLVVIWGNFFSTTGPEELPTTEESDLGTFYNADYSESVVLKSYLSNVISLLENAEFDEFYKLVSKEYLSYFKLNEFTLKESLQAKKILGYKMTYDSYSKAYIDGKVVYNVKLVALDKTSSIDMNIIEYSPNNYKLSFDNYITGTTEKNEVIKNGLKLEITEKEYLNDRLTVKCKLTNLNTYDVYLNSTHNPEIAYFRAANGNDYLTEATVLGGRTEIVEPNGTINLTVQTKMNFTQFDNLVYIVLKDVKLGENGVSSIFEFEF